MQRNPQALLLNLYQQSQSEQIIQMPEVRRFEELHRFRQHVEITSHLPYTALKNKVFKYRLIFLALGLLFLILGMGVTLTTHSLPFIVTTGAFFTARNLMLGICMLMGMSAFGVATNLTVEKEAANRIARRAKRGLLKAIAKKHGEEGVQGFAFLRFYCNKTASLSQGYKEALEKLRDQQEELSHLFERISKADFLNAVSREHLFNQALLESADKAKGLVLAFRKKI